jgi:hypothetical protein
MTDPLDEIRDYRDSLYSANVVGPTDLISIRMNVLDTLIGEVEDKRTQLVGALDGWRTESRVAIERSREIEQLRAELRLARAVIHELAWGPDTITDRPRLRDALKAWGEADKAELPPEGEQP